VRVVEFVRLRRHQRLRGAQAARCLGLKVHSILREKER
jgi:hypothetical protein